MNKINELIFTEMARQGLTKNQVTTRAQIGNTTLLTRFSRGKGISTITLEKILDLLWPGWEERFK